MKARFSGALVIGFLALILPAFAAGIEVEDRFTIDLADGEVTGLSRTVTFSLGLDMLDLDRAGTFRLFPDIEPASVGKRVGLGPGPTMSLVFSADDDRIPEALRMSFKKRTWKDYDGWEKAGFVLGEVSAAVGAGYLLYRLLD